MSPQTPPPDAAATEPEISARQPVARIVLSGPLRSKNGSHYNNPPQHPMEDTVNTTTDQTAFMIRERVSSVHTGRRGTVLGIYPNDQRMVDFDGRGVCLVNVDNLTRVRT